LMWTKATLGQSRINVISQHFPYKLKSEIPTPLGFAARTFAHY
jgi:hypothetical protein